jgi:DNA-binding protein HU-beta
MKKADFIQKLSEEINQSKKDTAAFIDAFINLITGTVKSGDEVVLPELGKFSLKKSPAREGRNPMTGATVKIAAKVTPKFRPSKKFKEAILGVAPAKKPAKK